MAEDEALGSPVLDSEADVPAGTTSVPGAELPSPPVAGTASAAESDPEQKPEAKYEWLSMTPDQA
ncbi:hypothetical protein T484DRAFT_1761945, partial [Baffinella frigidus]